MAVDRPRTMPGWRICVLELRRNGRANPEEPLMRADARDRQPESAERESLSEPMRRHQFMGRSIDLPSDLTEAQLDGRACVYCGAKDQPMRPVEAWSELSSQLFQCVDVEACVDRRRPMSRLRS